eukprot:9465292-Alexandrium_andersonii.AAC.1
MLGFSLLEAKSKDDREEILAVMKRSQMFGFYGNITWGKRNVAKFLREGGHMLRFQMRVIEEMSKTQFSHIDW